MEEFHYEQERNFLGSCVITPTKLSRLVNIVGSRLAKMNGPVLLQVTTTTKSGKKSVFDTLETALCQELWQSAISIGGRRLPFIRLWPRCIVGQRNIC